jgi:hypothetical protein
MLPSLSNLNKQNDTMNCFVNQQEEKQHKSIELTQKKRVFLKQT